MGLFGRKKRAVVKSYDSENMKPVIRCSICTGEQAAGFRNKRTGQFTEVMLVRNDKDLKEFMEMYGLKEVEKEY